MSVAELSPKPQRRATAESMATKQREISVSEFFTKNRHLLGFDNPAKALLTTVKEAVDNSLDACEEAGILPTIVVEISEVSENRFRVTVEDNGPGIVKNQIPKIFAKLLYGSKFHRLKQARGQQGIGISAAGLYAMLTTGRPIGILSKTGKGRIAQRVELRIDTRKNQPDVLKEEQVEWDKDHGTKVELELTGTYRGGRTGVDAYLEQSVVANPHLELTYRSPKGEVQEYPRASHELPREAQEIKPHPHGIELGMLLKMLQDSEGMTVKSALVDNFSRVSPSLAQSICEAAGVKPNRRAPDVHGEEVERLYKALGEVKVMAPPATCVVPIGEELIVAGLKRRFVGGQYFSTTRPPAVYRGNPFVVECGIAYGGDLPLDDPAEVLRFANRVPLQYQPKACAISEAVYELNWKNYGLAQPRGSLPLGPMAIFVHLASVWVPFTSEAKEAVAHYPELLREITLALQECGRRLAQSLRARARLESEAKRRSLFERYIPELGMSLGKITGRPRDDVEKLFLKALPNFVNMKEPLPEGPPEGSGAGGAAAPEAPSAEQADQKDERRPSKRGQRAKPEKGTTSSAKKGKRASVANVAGEHADEKSGAARRRAAKGVADKSARGQGAASKDTAEKSARGKSAAKKGGRKTGRGTDQPGPGKKFEQLKLIE